MKKPAQRRLFLWLGPADGHKKAGHWPAFAERRGYSAVSLLRVSSAGFSLRGRAEVTQGSNRLRADAIRGFTSNGDLNRIEATGGVYFVTPDQSMKGDRAVYTLNDGNVVVTGDVILTQGKSVLTGNRLVYNVRTETARIEGGGANGRVQGVFYPQGN